MTTTTDPLRVVWEALEAAGCQPHGEPYDFRAACPHHRGENPDALHVSEGADRRVLIHCFAHRCATDGIVEALGLQMRDLFPPGHRHHRLRPRPRPTPRGPVEVVLDGLSLLGIGYRGMWVADRCPRCGAPGLWVRANVLERPWLECAEGCWTDDILGTLEAAVAIAEADR